MDETTTGTATETATAETPAPATPPPTPPTARAAVEAVAAKHATTETGEATTQPAVAGGDSPASKEGPIPFKVHRQALENARAKAVEEWKQKYGWAEQVDRGAVEQAVEIARLYGQDKAGYIRQLLTEAVQDSTLAPVVRSEAARILAGGTHAGPVEPQIEHTVVRLEDGSTLQIPTPDSLNKRMAWEREQAVNAALEKLAPAQQAAEEFNQAKAYYAAKQQAESFAGKTYAELQALPQFKEHEADIKAALAETNLESDHPAEVRAAVYAIYNRLVLPTLTQTEHAQTLATLKQKAAAQTETVNAAAPATKARPKTALDAVKQAAMRLGSGSR